MVNLKRTQVHGEAYRLPEEEVTVQKLIKKGLTLDRNIRELSGKLEEIKRQLTDIAESRREGKTTVVLDAVSGESAKVTFRERYEPDDAADELKGELGSLWGRFFEPKTGFKATKDLKQFLEGEHAFGLENPEPIKELIYQHVKKKTTKPNVKLSTAE